MNQEKFETFRKAAIHTYSENVAEWMFDTWKDYNERYFNGVLEPSSLVIALTPYGRTIGLYGSRWNTITLHPSLLKEVRELFDQKVRLMDVEELGIKFASDVLLHEMIHQIVEQEYPEGNARKQTAHNNPNWITELNRLIPLLGLSAKAGMFKNKRVNGSVKRCPPEGCMAWKHLAGFPHLTRERGFYDSTLKVEDVLEKIKL